VFVVCESCSTRFRLDDDRIPAKGRLVRCSQCKATFLARPERASFEDTVQEVVAEVTDAGGPPVPEPAADLFDMSGDDLVGSAPKPGTGGDEERWEFDEEPRGSGLGDEPKGSDLGGEPQGSDLDTEPPSSALPKEPQLDEIGDPMEWDLLRGSVEADARTAQFTPLPAPAPVAAVEPLDEPFLKTLAEERPVPARSGPRALPRAVGAHLARVLRAGAWLALAPLAALGVTPLLHGATTRPAPPPARTVALPDGGEVRDVRGRFLENAFAPSLFVVQGELARPKGDPALGLRVYFIDADGTRLGAPVWAGAAGSPAELRERTPEALAAEIEASASRLALGGRFVALLPAPPEPAVGFAFALEPLPLPPAAPAEAAPEATASSAPASLPSAE
jgi:predicted Zn finger-like uncharacterized protein